MNGYSEFKLNLNHSTAKENDNFGLSRVRNQPQKPLTARTRDGESWRDRVKRSNQNNCMIFHKRSNTNATMITNSAQNMDNTIISGLKEELSNKERYLQELIEEIVVEEQQHKREMDQIDLEYQAEIEKLHEMLKQQINKNRQLQGEIE